MEEQGSLLSKAQSKQPRRKLVVKASTIKHVDLIKSTFSYAESDGSSSDSSTTRGRRRFRRWLKHRKTNNDDQHQSKHHRQDTKIHAQQTQYDDEDHHHQYCSIIRGIADHFIGVTIFSKHTFPTTTDSSATTSHHHHHHDSQMSVSDRTISSLSCHDTQYLTEDDDDDSWYASPTSRGMDGSTGSHIINCSSKDEPIVA